MAALPCTVATLLDASKVLIGGFNDHELLAAEVLLREQLDAKADARAARTFRDLLAAAQLGGWITLPQKHRDAIEVRQLLQTAVDNAARSSSDVTVLKSELPLSDPIGAGDLRGILAMLKCGAR